MKKIFFFAAIICSIAAQAQIKMPAASTTQKISQEFGMGSVEITYSRPNIKGRSLFKEGSELAPLGKVWRTGANASTKIKFTEKTMVGGKLLDTGTYVLYTTPGKDYWEIIINKGISNWGTDGYKESETVNSFKVKADKLPSEMETFTIQITNVMAESCDIHLMWGVADVKIPISVNIRERIRAQVEKALSGDAVTGGTYFQAANFYYEMDKDLNKALTNVTKAAQADPKAYYILLTQAKIQRDLGDKAGAKATAQKSAALATEAKNEDYVRAANELIKKL